MKKAESPTTAGIPTSTVAWNRYAIFLLLALVGFGADMASKHWIFARLGMPGISHTPLRIFGDVLCLETSLNEGALFGMGQGLSWIFISLSMVAIVGICLWLFQVGAAHDLFLTASLGLITAGISGNLWDRLGMPHLVWPYGPRVGDRVYAVRDWIHFQIPNLFDFPVFNIADSMLVIGVSLLLWQTLTMPPEQAKSESFGA